MTKDLQLVWTDSRDNKREEGGWIFMSKSGKVKVVRAVPGSSRTSIPLGDPPEEAGWIVVANFHSHDFGTTPSETVQGYVVGDIDLNTERDRIPGLILGNYAQGYGAVEDWTTYGPERGYFRLGVPERCTRTRRASAGIKGRVR